MSASTAATPSPGSAPPPGAFTVHPDPVFVSARREALAVAGVSLAAGVYTIVVCGLWGYGRDPKSLTFVLGFPDWVFWGIVIPWAFCVAASLYLGATFMQDEDLGDDEPAPTNLSGIPETEGGAV
jgi:hypothetical protein